MSPPPAESQSVCHCVCMCGYVHICVSVHAWQQDAHAPAASRPHLEHGRAPHIGSGSECLVTEVEALARLCGRGGMDQDKGGSLMTSLHPSPLIHRR